MSIIGSNDILVLEKNEGTVRRIVNGVLLKEPLLDVNVANNSNGGMSGIAISQHEPKDRGKPIIYVFLYYTETIPKDGENLEKTQSVINRLYRYELVDNTLINPTLLLQLPGEPGPRHSGGVVLIGPDKNVYLVIGDVDHRTEAQNIFSNKADGTGGVLRMTQDGMPVGKGILGDTYPLNRYYAYGIRNSFGMDFDPVTGNLWDTENGNDCCDEINLVEPGFNSGWDKVQGVWQLNDSRMKQRVFKETSDSDGEDKLVTFKGKGMYSSPEFTWNHSVGPSALKFLNSDKLGKQYENDIFIGNVNDQTIYHFDLTNDRRQLLLNGNLTDKISDSSKEMKGVIFAKGLLRVTDIEVGPDGNLYVLSHSWDADNQHLRMGTIFRISKNT